jgi:hypothetical protein
MKNRKCCDCGKPIPNEFHYINDRCKECTDAAVQKLVVEDEKQAANFERSGGEERLYENYGHGTLFQ